MGLEVARSIIWDCLKLPHKLNRIGRERSWPPSSRAQYDGTATLRGSNFVGEPEQIIEKILFEYGFFKHQRLLLQLSLGKLPHHKMLRAIELYGTKVAPVVRKEIASRRESTHILG